MEAQQTSFPDTGYEKLWLKMYSVWKERTESYAQKTDHLLIMKRAARILCVPTWQHGLHMITQKFSRLLQEWEQPGKLSQELFEDICVDMANFLLLTAEAHGRAGETA